MKNIVLAVAVLGASTAIYAADVTYQYTGTTSGAMTVDNGTSKGTVPSGTPFTGTLTFDEAQTVAPVPFSGGTHSVYTFKTMTMTMMGTTVSWGPGTIDVYDNLTSTSNGYPIGDSFYANISSMVAPSGSFNGAQFNWIFLGLVDGTGTAFTSSSLPTSLNMGSFASAFAEFNYGTKGTPGGAGNTSMLQFISTLSKTGGSPTPPPTITTTSLPPGVIGVPYTAPVTATAPNNDPVNLSVGGLPNGLVFSGGTINGTPQVVGTFNVSITAVDTVTNLSTTATLPLTINNSNISFNPTLPNGIVLSAYSATFAAATGGTGVFTYKANGLPNGLSLNGTTVYGVPQNVGVFNVALTATDSSGKSVTANVSLTITDLVPGPCDGKDAVISAYVARNPGYIVVNGGQNLLDHLWTNNLNPTNTVFLGGLVNWYQTGLIVDYTGTVITDGCLLTSLTVRPAVTINTTSLPGGTAGLTYIAPVSVSWGVAPYTITVAGLPNGLTFDGVNITGTPKAVGTFNVTITAVDKVNATAKVTLPLTVLDQTIVFNPALPAGTVGVSYSATLTASGFGPFTYTATGLPPGLSVSGDKVVGIPTTAGTYAAAITATDAAGASLIANATVTINAGSGGYDTPDEGKGRITAIGPNYSYLMVDSKKLIWDANTTIIVNLPRGDIHVIDSNTKVGMKVQWKGMLNKTTNTNLTNKLEVN